MNRNSNITPISIEELHSIKGGESITLDRPGAFARAIGDDVDIQSGDGFVSASSSSSSDDSSGNSLESNSLSDTLGSRPQMSMNLNGCGFSMM